MPDGSLGARQLHVEQLLYNAYSLAIFILCHIQKATDNKQGSKQDTIEAAEPNLCFMIYVPFSVISSKLIKQMHCLQYVLMNTNINMSCSGRHVVAARMLVVPALRKYVSSLVNNESTFLIYWHLSTVMFKVCYIKHTQFFWNTSFSTLPGYGWERRWQNRPTPMKLTFLHVVYKEGLAPS